MEPEAIALSADVLVHTDDCPLIETEITGFLNRAAPHLIHKDKLCSVEVLLTGDEEMRQLNARYRGLDRTTDVLSFPDGEIDPETERVFLGSIVISLDRAAEQAVEIGHQLDSELYFLMLHGLLHLMGYDHETDDGEMLALQRSLQSALNLKPGGEPVR